MPARHRMRQSLRIKGRTPTCIDLPKDGVSDRVRQTNSAKSAASTFAIVRASGRSQPLWQTPKPWPSARLCIELAPGPGMDDIPPHVPAGRKREPTPDRESFRCPPAIPASPPELWSPAAGVHVKATLTISTKMQHAVPQACLICCIMMQL